MNVFASFIASAIQLNVISSGAGLLITIVNPFILLLVIRYCIPLVKILLAMFIALAPSSSAIVALTTGWATYSRSNVISTCRSPRPTTANPPLSLERYGLPKKNTSSLISIFPFKPLILSTSNPFVIIFGVTISNPAPILSVNISEMLELVAPLLFCAIN